MSEIQITKYQIKTGIDIKARACFLSDLHLYSNEKINRAIDIVSPDFILVGGDFTHNQWRYSEGIEFLEYWVERKPVFASLGNHETVHREELFDKIINTGVTLLDNTFTEYEDFCIGGFSSVNTKETNNQLIQNKPKPDVSWLDSFYDSPKYNILLCHHPEYVYNEMNGEYKGLVLSGHAHGGQWRIFGHGIYSPGQGIFPKYTSGCFDNTRGGHHIISRGIGNGGTIVPRINNPPEILLIDFE